MAVNAPSPPFIPPVPGFRLATRACGIKNDGRRDLLLVEMRPSNVAGVFTRNQVVAAPVILCQQRLANGQAQALLVNSGNANAGLGGRGLDDARAVSRAVSELLNISDRQLFLASTGVIGQPLPVERIEQALPGLAADLQPGNWTEGAEAIMTTDTFAKSAHRRFELDGKTVLLAGIAKGSGMIHPDMATMLAFLFTDAAVSAPALQTLLERAVAVSFNSITVDGDTSTNDTVLAFASGAAGGGEITAADDPRAAPLATALIELCQELAQNIVRDGEGASKFITLRVEGAGSVDEAKRVAMCVAKSPLVKTAFAGSDANWGRILAAVGYAGVPVDLDRLQIHLGAAHILKNGLLNPDYEEAQGAAVMAEPEIALRIDLGRGTAGQTVWTCDLTHGYITINADYRT